MFYIFLLIVALLGAVGYLAFFMASVPGAKEERFGRLPPLPDNLGEWVRSPGEDAAGRIREERYLFQERTGLGAGKLILQVRYRDPVSNEIVGMEDERVVPRRRIKD